MRTERWKWIITGGVQGVGFRPFVYKAALEARVTGLVLNTPEGVLIEVQGGRERLEAFEAGFNANVPPLARIVTWERETADPVPDEEDFRILKSTGGAGHQVLISPDVATCDDCIADLRDPANRRHRYAFTNCTNCGRCIDVCSKDVFAFGTRFNQTVTPVAGVPQAAPK